MVGLRGVGKTVLLDRMLLDAQRLGARCLRIESPEERSLPAILAPELRTLLLSLNRIERTRDLATRALRALAGFVTAMKIDYQDITAYVDFDPEPGLADNGDLELDLQTVLEAAGEAAKSAGTMIIMFIDELQYVAEDQLAALIAALHRCAQRQLPVMLVGAGLPQLRARTGRAKSYAERLFEFPEIGALSTEDARRALVIPATDEGVSFADDALDDLVERTHGYPYFIQEWGKHVWDAADKSPITAEDVRSASAVAIAALDASFFRVRFDRLTHAEKNYVRAMAELGPGPHRSGDIARELGRETTAVGTIRHNLVNKGMVWSPSHGDTAFTVPLFDEFMKRIMPGDDWGEA